MAKLSKINYLSDQCYAFKGQSCYGWLAGELNHHLKPDEDSAAVFVANSRNGSSKKTIQSESGELELSIPRDRNGSFDPVLAGEASTPVSGPG